MILNFRPDKDEIPIHMTDLFFDVQAACPRKDMDYEGLNDIFLDY